MSYLDVWNSNLIKDIEKLNNKLEVYDIWLDKYQEYIKAIEREQNNQTQSQKEETIGIVEASEEHPNIVTVEAEIEEAE